MNRALTVPQGQGRRTTTRRRLKHLRREWSARFAAVGLFLFSHLPLPVARFFGRTVGRLCYTFLKKDRARAARHLELALGDELDEHARQETVKRMFVNLGRTFADISVMTRMGPEKVRQKIPVVGWENIERTCGEVLEGGKGLVGLTGHFGNWEMLAVRMTLSFPGRVASIGRRYDHPGYNRIVDRMRKRLGVEILYQDDSPRAPFRLLHDNGLLGILPDQDVKRVHGVFVDFFGLPAYTPSAPANFCLRVGSPIVPFFVVPEGRGYRAIVCEPIRASDIPSNSEDPVVAITELWTKVLEKQIRERPELWVWMHKRWHTTPEVIERRNQRSRA